MHANTMHANSFTVYGCLLTFFLVFFLVYELCEYLLFQKFKKANKTQC